MIEARAAILTLFVVSITGSARGQLADVPAALTRITPVATPLAFDRGSFEFPAGGHLQGIQLRFDAAANRHLVFLSHDSATVAYLVVVAFPAKLPADGRLLHVHTLPSDGRLPPLRHAGGMQLLGDVLVVGLEDNQQKTRSEIQFWNVSNPETPTQLDHLTIRRFGAPKDQTAGAVGIVRREKDHLLAVANWDSRAIDFYASGGQPLADPNCRFELLVRWQENAADKSAWRPDAVFGRYQAANLLADAAQNIFLVGFHTASADVVDLYAIDVTREPSRMIRKLASKTPRLAGGNHFQYAGGISILENDPVILSSPRNLGHPTRLNLAR